MVAVDVGIAGSVDEFPGLQPGHLGDHHGQERVGRDIERDAQEDVGAALVQLAGELAVRHVELVKGFNKALPEQFHIICDEKTGDKSFRNSDNRPLLTAKTWEDLSWGLMAFYIGYNYRHSEVKENA